MEDRFTRSENISLRHGTGTGACTRFAPRQNVILDGVLLLLLTMVLLTAPVAGSTLHTRVIEDGPRIIMEPHPESDIVCLTVSVPIGAAFETPETRGMSHFLEHMVFNGTERWTRTEMSDWVDERGAFLNAFTRKEVAVYFLVVARDDLEQGMELLSQMLLHSIFPPDEFEKERKIILEELRKGMDDPSSKRERLVERYLYRGSALAEPVMGYASTIETISREDMMRFYHERFTTRWMRIHLAGGFDIEQAVRWILDYFPQEIRSGRPPKPLYELPRFVPNWNNEVTVRDAGDLEPGFDMMIRMPSSVGDYFSEAMLVADILMGESSPLPALFDSLSLPEPDVGFEVHGMFGALRIHLPWSDEGAESFMKVPEVLASLGEWELSDEVIESARTAHLSAELFDRERYHFYIMLHGEKIGLFGEEYLEAALDVMRKVKGNGCRRFIRSTFGRLRFNACLLRPAADGVRSPLGERGETRVLGNGCVVTARTRSNSGVAALHLLVEGRNCLDREAGLTGMSALLHGLFASSADGRRLSARLESLGCRLEWQDNPYIPMDDYYLNPAFSFVRLEAPVDKIEQAARLLLDFLGRGVLMEEDLGRVMEPFGTELRVRSGSSSAALRERVYRELLGDHPYGSPIFPTPEGLRGVTIEQVNAFREDYLQAGNLIASMISSMPEVEALDMLDRLFSDLPPGESAACPPLPEPDSYREVAETTQKEGAYLAAGWLLREEAPDRIAALLVASQVLSRRMQQELREKQGLTYSTGCGVTLIPGGAVAMATIGTRGQNLEVAESGLKAEIERLTSEPPDHEEIEIARSRLLGYRARSELSSINEASSACRDLFMTGNGIPMNVRIARVTAVEAVSAAGLLTLDRVLIVKLLPGEGGEEKSVPPAMRMRMK